MNGQIKMLTNRVNGGGLIMPTGYTAPIYNGDNISFKDFVLRCARQFGALYHMREEPMDAPIKKRKLDTYYLEGLKEAIKDLEEFSANPPTRDSLAKEWADRLAKLKEEDAKRNKERHELRTRYIAMLRQVQAWVPPTDEHRNLKEFMISQIQDSIEYDCHIWNDADKFPTMEQYIENSLSCKHLEKEVEYYQEQWEKEVKRCEEANKWIEDLEKSL